MTDRIPIGRQHGSSQMPDDLAPMENMKHAVAEGQPDPRGYDLMGHDEQKLGTIHSLLGSPSTDRAYFVLVDAAGAMGRKQYAIPLEILGINDLERRAYGPFTQAEFAQAPDYQANSSDFNRYYTYWNRFAFKNPAMGADSTMAAGSVMATDSAMTSNSAMAHDPAMAADSGIASNTAARNISKEVRVPVTEEEAQIRKEQREIGHVVLRKGIETETQHISEPVMRTHVEVERRAVPADQQHAYAAEGTALKDGETIRVPVVEEELIVQKVPRVTEEVIIRQEAQTRQVEQDVQLRRDRVEVDEEGDVDVEAGAGTRTTSHRTG